MMKHVYRPRKRVKGKLVVGRIYRLRFRLSGQVGEPTDISLQTSDQRVAEEKARKIIQEKEQELAGIIPPASLRLAADRALADHLADYIADLEKVGRDESYTYTLDRRLSALLKDCGWKLVRDITPDSFQAWRGRQRMSPKTLNDYLAAVISMCGWLIRNGRMVSNPLLAVARVETRGKETRIRRAFTPDEIRKLLEVSGPRATLYLTALHTGLRRAELEGLRWGDVHLDAAPPYLTVRASMSKNHKEASLPLHPELAARLMTLRPVNAAADGLVFAKLNRMVEFKRDLADAGIPFLDAHGRRADFHSFRHTCATNLHLAGVAPRTAMEVLRHSDMKLTAKVYTDTRLLPLAEELRRMPGYLQPATRIDTSIATSELFRRGQGESSPDTLHPIMEPTQPLGNEQDIQALAAQVVNSQNEANGSGGRARTYNMRINSALLYH